MKCGPITAVSGVYDVIPREHTSGLGYMGHFNVVNMFLLRYVFGTNCGVK